MEENKDLMPFEGKPIRKIWHEGVCYFSVVDVIEVLTDSKNPKVYWGKLKERDSQLLTNCQQLKLVGRDGRSRPSDCADTEGVFRIIMSVPSPKAEPLKLWMAQVSAEKVEETENPELSYERMAEIYRAKGRTEEWIKERFQSIETRKRLTDEWKTRGIKEGQEYGILTATIAKGTFGLTPSEHSQLKGLEKQNLRDHMTPMELIFTSLSEEITRTVAIKNDAQGFNENHDAAHKGGQLAGEARERLEQQLEISVVSAENLLSKIHFMPLKTVLAAYGFDLDSVKIDPFGSGLINHTWRVEAAGKAYILQRINHHIFKKPEDIAENIGLIGAYLRENHPHYLFVSPVKTRVGEEMVFLENDGYFRMFPFVAGSHSKDVVKTVAQAHEAAVQFGRFTRLLSNISDGVTSSHPVTTLKTTLPDFHNLTLRHEQFLVALTEGNKERIEESDELIKILIQNSDIAETYKDIVTNAHFKLRVTHHDTKISNVLFDKNDKGLCVIDLDTVMPGYFISDVGDMMRTYLSPVSEEETDFSKVEVRDDFYQAITEGYLSEMNEVLTDIEKRYFFYAGKFMIYMQALRFLTDYLSNDVYYGAKYPKHNFNRAKNQAVLLQKLMKKESRLNL